MIGAATYNVQDLYLRSDPQREKQVYRVIRELRDQADELVLAVQEVVAAHDGGTAAFDRLASATGLVPGPCARGHHIRGSGKYHWLGLLWSGGVSAAGPAQTFDGDMWHNLVAQPIRIEGRELLAGSYHGDPFNKEDRLKEARRIAGAWSFPSNHIGWVAGDFNGLAAERRWQPDEYGGYWTLEDRLDPYRPDPEKPDNGWTPGHLFQVDWVRNERGDMAWKANRDAGEFLYTAQLWEAHACLNVAPRPTSGHHPDDPHGPRMVDRVHVTPPLVEALSATMVIDTPDSRAASDHLPSAAWINLDAIRVP